MGKWEITEGSSSNMVGDKLDQQCDPVAQKSNLIIMYI